MIRRLQRVYSVDEYANEPLLEGFQELFYSEDGNIVEVRMLGLDEVWHDNLNLWNDDNTNNLKLYPDYPLWNKVDVKVGGIDVYKYVEIE